MSYGYFPNSSSCGYGLGGGLFATLPFHVPNWAGVNPINNMFTWNPNLFAFGNPCNTFSAINTLNPLNAINYATRFNPNIGMTGFVNPINAINPISAINPINFGAGNIAATPAMWNPINAGLTNPVNTPIANIYGNCYPSFAGWPTFGTGINPWIANPITATAWPNSAATTPSPAGVNPFVTAFNPSSTTGATMPAGPFFGNATHGVATTYAATNPNAGVATGFATHDVNVESFFPATAKGGPQGTYVHPHSGSFYHAPTGTFCHRPSGTILNLPSGIAMVGAGINGTAESMARAASCFFGHPATQWINSIGQQWSVGEFFDFVNRS